VKNFCDSFAKRAGCSWRRSSSSTAFYDDDDAAASSKAGKRASQEARPRRRQLRGLPTRREAFLLLPQRAAADFEEAIEAPAPGPLKPLSHPFSSRLHISKDVEKRKSVPGNDPRKGEPRSRRRRVFWLGGAKKEGSERRSGDDLVKNYVVLAEETREIN